MSGLSRFSAANSLFRPRSGRSRVSGQAQNAANRANDSDSMRIEDGIPTINPRRFQRATQQAGQVGGQEPGLDEGEIRANLPRLALAQRSLRRQIAEARDMGDFDTMEALQGQLQDLAMTTRADVRALNPRGITAERLEAGRSNLIDQFPANARQSAQDARDRAGGLGSQIDAESTRIGRRHLGAIGVNPDDAEIGEPGGAQRLGELATPGMVSRFGIDQRPTLQARRDQFLQQATDLEGRAERGLELPPIDSERLAARYAAEDEAARRQALEAQRQRFVEAENKRLGLAAEDTLEDLGREAALSTGRGGAAMARTGETAAGTQEFLAGEEGRTVRDRAGFDRRAALAEAERLAREGEGERDLVGERAELAGLELERDQQRVMAEIESFTGSSGVPKVMTPEVRATIADPMFSVRLDFLREKFDAFEPGKVLSHPDSFPQAAVDTIQFLDSDIMPQIRDAMASDEPNDVEFAKREAQRLLSKMPLLSSDGTLSTFSTSLPFIGRSRKQRQELAAKQLETMIWELSTIAGRPPMVASDK